MALGLQGNIRQTVWQQLLEFLVVSSAVPFVALDHGRWGFPCRCSPTVSFLYLFLEGVGEPSLATTMMLVLEAL